MKYLFFLVLLYTTATAIAGITIYSKDSSLSATEVNTVIDRGKLIRVIDSTQCSWLSILKARYRTVYISKSTKEEMEGKPVYIVYTKAFPKPVKNHFSWKTLVATIIYLAVCIFFLPVLKSKDLFEQIASLFLCALLSILINSIPNTLITGSVHTSIPQILIHIIIVMAILGLFAFPIFKKTR